MKMSRASLKGEINVTPMIDVLLMLLIIFMVISPVRSAGLDSQIPHSNPDDAQSRDEPDEVIVVSIHRDLSIQINHQTISPPLLQGRLKAILKSRTDRSLFIQADSELPFEAVAATIDSARGAGADRIGLWTEKLHATPFRP